MKRDNERLISELNHRTQILMIDTELFIKSYVDEGSQNSKILISSLKELNDKFIKIKDSKDLSKDFFEFAQNKITSVLDTVQEIKVQSSMGKNEKIAILNQLYGLRELVVVKK